MAVPVRGRADVALELLFASGVGNITLRQNFSRERRDRRHRWRPLPHDGQRNVAAFPARFPANAAGAKKAATGQAITLADRAASGPCRPDVGPTPTRRDSAPQPSGTPAMKLDPIIAPSILSADFARLGEDTAAVLAAGADWVHFDVMDNHYVPNLTIGPLVCQALRDYGISAPIDVHLMVKPVDRIIPDFAKAGASLISFHPEASEHVDRTLGLIHDSGCQAGLVFNPATPLSWLDHVIDRLDLILLMSVNPGFGGQQFIPGTLAKLRAVRERIDASGRTIRLQVDGGVKTDNIGAIAAAGADTFVAGSAIFGSADYAATITDMRAAIASAG